MDNEEGGIVSSEATSAPVPETIQPETPPMMPEPAPVTPPPVAEAMPVATPPAQPEVQPQPMAQPVQQSTPQPAAAPASGKPEGPNGPVPADMPRWNWGAFTLSFPWGIAHGNWIAPVVGLLGYTAPIWGLFFVISRAASSTSFEGSASALLSYVLFFFGGPLIGLGTGIYMGIKGNEIAWRNRRFRDYAHFQEVQRKWKLVGIPVFILLILAIVGIFVAGSYQQKKDDQALQQALDQADKDQAASDAKYTKAASDVTLTLVNNKVDSFVDAINSQTVESYGEAQLRTDFSEVYQPYFKDIDTTQAPKTVVTEVDAAPYTGHLVAQTWYTKKGEPRYITYYIIDGSGDTTSVDSFRVDELSTDIQQFVNGLVPADPSIDNGDTTDNSQVN